VIDEAYYEYALHTPGFPDALSELRAQDRPWIVLRTFSKAWGLAGLRVGYGIASDERLVQMLDRVRTPFNVNLAAQTAALAAWNDAAYMERCVRDTVSQREWLATQLRTMGVVMAPSAANFLFLNLQRPNGPVAEALLARGVVVKPWKEAGYESFIRVSIASVEDNALFLQAFTDAMRDSV
jgi:histidinol-phosphate aminotransferase